MKRREMQNVAEARRGSYLNERHLQEVLVAWNDEIEAGAKAIAKDFELPGGRRTKLARVVVRHLGWFDAAEARGLTWDDMIAVLAAAGARRKNGLPLSRGTLSSTVWRKRNEGAAGAKRPDRQPVRAGASNSVEQRTSSRSRPGPANPVLASPKRKASGGEAPATDMKSSQRVLGKTGIPRATAKSISTGRKRQSNANRHPDEQLERAKPPTGGRKQGTAPGSADVLAFMKRAAKLRQRHDDG